MKYKWPMQKLRSAIVMACQDYDEALGICRLQAMSGTYAERALAEIRIQSTIEKCEQMGDALHILDRLIKEFKGGSSNA